MRIFHTALHSCALALSFLCVFLFWWLVWCFGGWFGILSLCGETFHVLTQMHENTLSVQCLLVFFLRVKCVSFEFLNALKTICSFLKIVLSFV